MKDEKIEAEFAAKLWTFFGMYIGDGSGEFTPPEKEFLKQVIADLNHALDQQRDTIVAMLDELQFTEHGYMREDLPEYVIEATNKLKGMK